MPGMLSAMAWNINRKSKDLKFFELGEIYSKNAVNTFAETKYLSIALTGETATWAEGSRPISFFDLKGMIENLLCELGVENVTFKQAEDGRYSNSCAASIEISGETIGTAARFPGRS